MKKLLCLIFLINSFTKTYAQTHSWAKEAYSNTKAEVIDLSIDSIGNSYIVGNYIDSLIIDKKIKVSTSTEAYNDAFIAKLDTGGKLKWLNSIYLKHSFGNFKGSLSLGNIFCLSNSKMFVYGFFGGTRVLMLSPNDSLINKLGENAGFMAIYDSSGRVIVSKILLKNSYYNNVVNNGRITIDKQQNIYLFTDGKAFKAYSQSDSIEIKAKFDSPFVIKYSPMFNKIIWYKDVSDSGSTPSGLLIHIRSRIGKDNNLYLATAIDGKDITINKKSFHFSKRILKAFLIVLSPEGKFLHTDVINSDTSQFDNLADVEAEDTNHIYITGYVQDSILTGGKCYKSSNPKSKGIHYPYIGLYSITKKAKWINLTQNKDSFYIIADNFYYYFVNFDKSRLNFNKKGYIFSTFKHYNYHLSIGGLSDSSKTINQFGFAKFDSLGNALWLRSSPRICDIEPIGQNIIYSGSYNNYLKLKPFTLKYSKNSSGFIAKTNDYSIDRGFVKQGPYCSGDTILIPFSKNGDFDSTNYFIAELSDELGNFYGKIIELGKIKTNKDSVIYGILPFYKFYSSSKYRIRIRSTNPPVQSYYRYDILRLLIYSRDKADPGLPDTICLGDTIKLNTYGGTKWTWSPKYKMNDSSLRQPLVNPDTTIIYRIIIADSSGCGQPDTAFKLIVVKPSPKAILGFTDTALCENQQIKIPVKFVFGDTQNYSWKWYLVNSPKSYFYLKAGKSKQADTLQLITSVDNTYSQKFAVILTDNCSTKSDTAFVNISQRSEVKITSKPRDTTLCYGKLINYTAQATGGVAKYYRYSWKDLLSNTILSDSALLKTTAKNTLKIQLTVNDGCLALGDTTIFYIKVKPKLELVSDLQNTTVCQNRSLSFSANAKGGDSSNYSFKWLLNNKEIGTGKNLFISALTSTLTLTLTDHCSIPEDSIKAKITVLPAPQADFTTGITCSKTKTDFTFTGKKITNTTFEWNFDNESKAYSENASYMFSSAGNKTIKLITKADNNCNDTIEKIIEIKKQAKAEFETKDVCENDSAVFINKSKDADEFLWKFGDGLKSNKTTPNHKYQIPKTTTFLVTLVAKSGCSDSVTNPITVNQNPNSDFTYNQNGDKLELKAQSGYSQYKWKFNNKDSISVTTENYIHTLKDWSPIKICLQITDINNCTSQTCKTVTLGIKQTVKSPNFKIYPNPNSGTFTIETQNNDGMEIQIFDVLGREISFEHDKTLSNFQIIKFSNSKGIYYIKLRQNGVTWDERVVVGE